MTQISHNRPALDGALFRGTGDGLIFFALALALLLFPLARGGNRLWVVSIFETWVFVLSALWALLYLLGRVVVPHALFRASPILLLWCLWLAYIALQSVPISAEALKLYAPRSAELHQAAAVFVDEEFTKAPVSIAAGETLTHALESFAYFCLFVLVLLLVRNDRRLKFLAVTLVLSGVFQALYGTVFLLSGAPQGLFMDAASPLNAATGTFINRNHFAGYLEITGAVGVGLVLAQLRSSSAGSWRGRFRNFIDFLLSETIRLRVFIALIVIGLVLTKSRGGNVAFVAALGVAGLIYVLLRERHLFLKALFVFATFFIVDMWIVANWFGLEQVVERLENTDASRELRVAIFPALLQVAAAYWPTGSGLGTFYTAFPPFRAPGVFFFHDHAHNDYLQFLIETGIGSVLLLGVVLLVLWHVLRVLVNRKNRLVGGIAFAALMAMIAIGIHSAVDFNLQIPANAATLVVVMAMAVSCSPNRRRRRSRSESDDSIDGLAS